MGLIPLMIGILYCAVSGISLFDIYLPNSYWNDELFYYKQVEGILTNGVPAGFFGFEESHGRLFSFAAWSPALLVVWSIWGVVLGWNFLSPILCNLVCMMAGMAGFALMARPGRKQVAAIGILYALFTPITRFTLSGVSEAICWFLILLYMGLVFQYERERSEREEAAVNRNIWWMFFLSGALTLMRPYFLLLMLYPAFLYGRKKWKKLILAVLIPAAAFGGYAAIKYFFGAAYLHDLFDLSFLTRFAEEGFAAGFHNLWQTAAEGIWTILRDYMPKALKYGHLAGSLYGAYGLLGLMLLFTAVWECKKTGKKEKKSHIFVLSVSLFFAVAAMFLAILFMYKTGEGSRHVGSFILMGILVLGMYRDGRAVILQGIYSVTFFYFFVLQAGTPYDYQLSYDDGVIRQEITKLSEELEASMELQEGIGWNNTVIWLAYDYVEGEVVSEAWQQLYAIPGGFGINYCSQPYVYDRLEQINSRYIAAIPGGDVEKQLLEKGAVFLAGNEKIAVYDFEGIKAK